jgi:hypothetical protein
MQGYLTPEIELSVFRSPGGLQLLTFGSVGFTFTLSPKWGCDTSIESLWGLFGRKIMIDLKSSCKETKILGHCLGNYFHVWDGNHIF